MENSKEGIRGLQVEPAMTEDSDGLRVKSAMTEGDEGLRIKSATKKKKKKKPSLSYIFGGKILTEDFVIKQSKLLFLIFCLLLVFISNRYYCSKKLTEMDNLKKELEIQQSEKMNLIRQLTDVGRQQRIEELLKENEIDLTKGSATIYQIQK